MPLDAFPIPVFSVAPEMAVCNGAGNGVTEAMGFRRNIGMGQSGCAGRKFLCACMEN